MDISVLAQLFIIFLLSSTNVSHADKILCGVHEKRLLLELREQLVYNSSYSTKLAQWNNLSDDCCNWEGVGCDDAGRVIVLHLPDEGISGRLNESSSLFGLEYLEELDMSFNMLEGCEIPREFHKLKRLTSLDLNHCSLTGYFPEAIFHLPTLQYLDLSFNPLLSLIPPTLGNLTQLVHLDLSHNFFTGSISSIHFESLSNLYHMDLSYNSLSGTIPTSIFTSLPSLGLLDLSHNQFSGHVNVVSVVNISTPKQLDLSSNRLESPIPNSFFSIPNLIYLFLSDNLFNETFQLEKILGLPSLTELDLYGNNLSLDDEPRSNRSASFHLLVMQSSLYSLDLSNNKAAGVVPSWIWEIGGGTLTYLNLSCNMLVDLQKPYSIPPPLSIQVLDLHSNQLHGELPSSLLQHAEYVDYSNNYFDSSIPSIGSYSGYFLQFLSVANNRLSGPLPTFICYCTNLQVLDLSGNNLSGSIPPCLFQNSDYLFVLNLGRNNITGHIPRTISPNCSLTTLDLSHNNLDGAVPLSLGNCNSLTVMNVGNNRIDGSFPCMLPSSLQVLVLRSNRFHGDITCPKNKTWPKLQIVDIASNNFSGYLNPLKFSTWRGMMLDSDTELERKDLGATIYLGNYYRDEVTLTIKGLELKLVKIWPEFTSIDFSCNNFHGDIPEEIGKLYSLYLLNLSHNAFGGSIPKSFGKLRQLGSLDLSVNRLTGKIPEEIAGLTFLQAMNVSHNELVGKIPTGSQIQTFSSNCFQGNLGLCGPPLNISCSNINPVSPPPQGNVESDKEIEWGYVFGAAGYAVGLGSFSWLLLFCRSFRYKYFEKVDDFFDKMFYRRQRNKRRDRRRRRRRRAVRNEVRRQ